MRSLAPMVFLLVFALLPGCSGGEGAGPDETSPAPDETSPAPTTTDPAAPPPPADERIPLDWDGHLGTNVCVPSGPNACSGLPVGTPSDAFLALDRPGSVAWNGTFTLTWTAETPATGTLELSIVVFESCGDGCYQGRSAMEAQGTSPITLELPATALQGNETGIWLSVDLPRQTPDPVYARLSTEQPFLLQGTATVRYGPSAAPTPSA